MRSLRYKIDLGDGVKCELLFTPHLYSFKGVSGVTFEADKTNEREMFEVYADMIFCAALNAWVLDGNGSVEDFPHKRGDFHAFMVLQPRDFGKVLNFALEALTGKSVREYLSDKLKEAESHKESKSDDDTDDGSKKKLSTRWIGRLLKRS